MGSIWRTSVRTRFTQLRSADGEQYREKSHPVFRKKAVELMTEMSTESPWFWKDPALSHFLPFWKQIWGTAIYIITVRNPFDTAVSWQKFIMPSNMKTRISFVAIPGYLEFLNIQEALLKTYRELEHR